MNKTVHALVATMSLVFMVTPSYAEDIVDCKSPETKKMVRQSINDWLALRGSPGMSMQYETIFNMYYKATSPFSAALKRKLDAQWNTDLTLCESGSIAGPMFVTIFMKSPNSGNVGGFVILPDTQNETAVFGDFDENLIR